MASAFPRYQYIISKRVDPVFAVTIGLSAALLRIRREERENGHPGTLSDIFSKGWKRQVASWTGEFNVEKVGGPIVGKS